MSAEDVIASAINLKICLNVTYQGHTRLVAPIRLGWKTTDEDGPHKNFFCYQLGGYSSKGLKPDGSIDNYRCWKLSDITSALPTKDHWREGTAWHTQRSKCIDDVIAGPPI